MKAVDKAYTLSIIKAFNNYLQTGILDQTLIARDSTASTLQHWATLLGVRKEYMAMLNLEGCEWSDTYTKISQIFLQQHPEFGEPEYASIRCRPVTKTLVMIVNYSAGVQRCLAEVDNLIGHSKNAKEDAVIKKYVQYFHNFISKTLFSLLFYLNKEECLLNNHVVVFDDAVISLIYIQKRKEKKELKINNRRWVFERSTDTQTVVNHTTNIALQANQIQARDGHMARYVLTRVQVVSVHDSFATRIQDVHLLMDTVNDFFDSKIKNRGYGLFVLV